MAPTASPAKFGVRERLSGSPLSRIRRPAPAAPRFQICMSHDLSVCAQTGLHSRLISVCVFAGESRFFHHGEIIKVMAHKWNLSDQLEDSRRDKEATRRVELLPVRKCPGRPSSACCHGSEGYRAAERAQRHQGAVMRTCTDAPRWTLTPSVVSHRRGYERNSASVLFVWLSCLAFCPLRCLGNCF
ncbi:hypothetical protein GJAV_G00272870 [Gymnothorax javanicus]|nr:hypothetical protein GJAV_G00272870 [Gymnothorax javanicus]